MVVEYSLMNHLVQPITRRDMIEPLRQLDIADDEAASAARNA